jgi:two-component sensor histidine kinase
VLPGTNLFQLVKSGNSDLPCLFMGESAMPALRQSIVRKFSNEIVFSNNLAAMSDTERDEFFKNARYDDIVGLKSLVLKDIKVKDNIFFVPRRSTKIYVKSGSRPHMSTVSSVGFWISNEITNKEYREFANDIISNPENILRWEERKYNSSISSYEEFKAVEIYSEIARSLIDSALNVTVFYEKQLQKINIIKYLNDDRYNDFPAVGVPLKGAEYYCRWLNQKHGFTERSEFQLPNDINYRILADYLKEIRNSKNSPRLENILHKIPNDTIAYLNTNAKEWYRPNLQRTGKQYPPSKFAVLERWDNFGDDIEYVYDDENSTVTGGFRIVRYSDENKAETINSVLIIVILLAIIILMTIVFLAYKWRVRQRLRKEEQNRKLRELELTAIRSQMNPHFLFNSLNSVQNLVQQNKGREAHLYLSDFAGLIRKVLNNSEKEEVSLAEELEMIQQYLNLEKLRFDFEFDINVTQDIDSHNTLVPSMLLQPFVENAVIHGLQSKPENRLLKIKITKEGKESGIQICIEDNGIGRAAAKKIAKAKNSKGTKLMRERLEILQEKQGEKYSLKIVDLAEGTRVEIIIPEEN